MVREMMMPNPGPKKIASKLSGLQPGTSEKRLVDRTKQEGFKISTTNNEARKAVFAQMKPGEFKIITYTEGQIAEDSENKTGRVPIILFKSPAGENMEKDLTKMSESEKYGWTKYAADCLIKALQKEEAEANLTSSRERVNNALNKGFKEKEYEAGTSDKAIVDAMNDEEFGVLSYPKNVVIKEPGKEGYIHTIVYKVGGRCFSKDLRSEANPRGWSKLEAQALVDGIKKESQETENKLEKRAA